MSKLLKDVRAALVKDPYNALEGSNFYIEEDAFYNKVYVPPVEMLAQAHEAIETGDNSVRILHINGYAGCGKTLIAHKLMRDFGPMVDFHYSFGSGGSFEIGLDSVASIMIERQASVVAQILLKDQSTRFAPLLGSLCRTKQEVAFLQRYREAETALFDSSEFGSPSGIAWCDAFCEILRDCLKAIEPTKGAPTVENQMIICLLLFDVCLRTKLHDGIDGDYIFCLLDNVDCLSFTASVSFFVDVCSVLEKLRNYPSSPMCTTLKGSRFIFLFPTREVTNKKIIAELRRREETQTISNPNYYGILEMGEMPVPLSDVVERRIKYWRGSLGLNAENCFDKLTQIFSLQTVERSFGPLFNRNYIATTDRIIDLCERYPQETNEICELLKKKHYENDAERAFFEDGLRGYVLRLIMELFKEEGMFDVPLSAAGVFDGRGKLGLAHLYLISDTNATRDDSPWEPGRIPSHSRITLSRAVLTFLRESPHMQASASDIIRCFEGISNEVTDNRDITSCLYALCVNGRDVWRRLVMFPEGEDGGYDRFHTRCISPMEDLGAPSVELCLSGRVFVDDVVPKFEFYLSRNGSMNSLVDYPPLLSPAGMRDAEARCAAGKWEEVACLQSIDYVTRVVEGCGNPLCECDTLLVRRCVEGSMEDYLERLFVRRAENSEETQLHLARIVFSHVGYIERFRSSYLWRECGTDVIPSDRPGLVAFNERVVSYIVRYLALFDPQPLKGDGFARELAKNSHLPVNFNNVESGPSCARAFSEIQDMTQKAGHSIKIKRLSAGHAKQVGAHKTLLEKACCIHNQDYKIIGSISIGGYKTNGAPHRAAY